MLNMLKRFDRFRRQPARKLRIVADPSATREDLQIRSLLDCPSLRRAMELDIDPEPVAGSRSERREVAA